jgi:hypothetical protein
VIKEARSALETLLKTAGFKVSPFVPARAVPPIAVLQPSSDWIESGDTPYSFRIGFDVTMLVQTATNEKSTENLDDMVEDALVAVSNAAGFYCGAIGNPGAVDANGVDYLGVTFTVYQNKQL